MKIIYLDLGTGAAGDMLMAALYELLEYDERKAFLDKMNCLGIEDLNVSAVNLSKYSIFATSIEVSVGGVVEGEHHHGEHNHGEHHHEHDHEEHHHEHHHSSMNEIADIIDGMPVSEAVKKNAKEVYGLIADAESKAHNKPVTDIHFHEVGTKDAIADVTGVCLLIEMLGNPTIIASPVCVGYGQVECAHGVLPVPAPATAYILNGIPAYAGNTEGEMCTPTGAALLKHFVSGFRTRPLMTSEKIGYGMGKKDFGVANFVRATLGVVEDVVNEVVELSCNVDDMTAEAIGYATELFMLEGALDVYTTAIGMKKSRPGTTITVMCRPEDKLRFVELMFMNTSTNGMREKTYNRYTLSKRTETFSSSLGSVDVNISEGYKVSRKKYEYDDLKKIAKEQGISLDQAQKIIDGEINDKK